MPQARGSQATIALYEESTYATNPATPSGQQLYVTQCTLASQQNRIDANTLTSARSRSQPAAGNINASGQLVFELGAESMGTILKHALGTSADTGANPYTHTLTIADLPVGLIIEKDFGANISGSGRTEYFNGTRIQQVTFDFPVEGYATCTMDCVAAKSTLGTAALDGTLTDNGHTPFSIFSGSITEGGTAIAYVQSASITLSNELDQSVYAIGGAGVRRALPEGFATITGSVTALFESAALLTKAIAGTESSLAVTLSRGDGLGSAGNESMSFTVQQLLFERTSPPISGPNGLLLTLPFKGYASGANLGLQVVVKNAVATA